MPAISYQDYKKKLKSWKEKNSDVWGCALCNRAWLRKDLKERPDIKLLVCGVCIDNEVKEYDNYGPRVTIETVEDWQGNGDTFIIRVDNEVVFDWYDGANSDFPEDLCWHREISGVFDDGVKLGKILAKLGL